MREELPQCDVVDTPRTRRAGPGRTPRAGDPVRRASLLTDDGVRIVAEARPPSGPVPDQAPVFVLAHGFTGALERPAVRRAAGVLAAFGPVVTFSFRGHGGSGGLCTVGDLEVLDLDVAVTWARAVCQCRPVATVGFSMGGSVALRQAALHPGRVDAVASVSSPGRWYYRGTPPMRRLHWAVEHRAGRRVLRHVLGARVDRRPWKPPLPLAPDAAAARIAPAPLLVVHGTRDHYFPVDHAQAIYDAAAEPRELWLEDGFGHAENAADEDLLRRIGRWLLARTGGVA